MSMKQRNVPLQRHNPQGGSAGSVATRLVLLPIHAYKFFVSPLLGNNCRFYPTCSSYAEEAIMTHGICRGMWLTLTRILRCNPWSAGGVDPVPPVVNSLSSMQEHPGHHGN